MNAPESFVIQDPETLDRIPTSARFVLKLLSAIESGQLTLITPNNEYIVFGRDPTLQGVIALKDWAVCGRTLQSGDIGFAECYMEGRWHSPDLPALLRLMVRNQHILERAVYGHWWGRLLYRLKHALNRNSRHNSERNIQAHYDLGNAFYQVWLDPSMNYSSAWFKGDFEQSLEDAQSHKVRRALEAVQLGAQDRLLEIGFGWGALAEMATQGFGARFTGVTLSKAQLAYTKERLSRLMPMEHADLRLQDYRDIPDASFDGICSIEMIEAVGRSYWPTYFSTLYRLLKPGKRACIQAIVLRDDQFDRYISGTDFIQQYVFPGGCLLSPAHVEREAKKAGLTLMDAFSFGRDYAETLRRWRQTFMSKLSTIRAQGHDEHFVRRWEFYLAYCEAAFEEGNTDVIQFTFERPL